MDMPTYPDRRDVLIGSFAAAAGLALGAGNTALAAPTSLRFTWWGGQARADRTLKALAVFAQDHPEINVDTEYLGWDDYWTRLATLFAGGGAPDVVQMDVEYLAEYASRGALAALDEYMPSPLAVSDFDKAILDNGRVDGKLYAIACGINAAALVLNKAAYVEAGVPLPDANTTWEQFGKIAADFTRSTTRKGMFGTSDESRNQEVFETWVRQRGKNLFNEDGSLGYAQEDMADWFAMWADMRATGAAPPPDVEALDHGDIDNSLLSQGRAACSFAYSNQFVAYSELVNDPLTMAPYPRLGADGKGGLYIKPTLFFSVAASSHDPAAAAGLVSYLLTNPGAVEVLGVERGIPASLSARDSLRPKLDQAGQLAIDYLSNLGSHAGAIPPANPPGGGEISDALRKASEEVAFETKSPADGAQTFYEEAQQILARNA
jgi:multiple sugar transport system substrate-binding protein